MTSLTSKCLGLLAATLLATGCSLMPWSDSPQQDLKPADFSSKRADASAEAAPKEKVKVAAAPVEPAAPLAPVDPEQVSPVTTTDAPPTPPTPTAPPIEPTISPDLKSELDRLKPPSVTSAPTTKQDQDSYTVDAMIGQVDGRPIYASQVLDPLKAQLSAMGQQMSRAEFRRTAARILSERLYQIVFDALFLAEAERRMSEQERFQLKVMMHLNRQELIRKYGAGSEPAADEELRKKTSKSLEETLTNIRQSILVRRYQENVIYPKIAVSKRDVERYYNRPEIFEKYNPKPGRKVRMIMVRTKANAEKVDALFAAGKSFEEIAKGELNSYNRDAGGKMTLLDKDNKETDVLQGEKLFGPEPMNEALAKLKAGEHSPRITVSTQFGDQYWWIRLDEVIEGKRRSLPEVQLELEQQIRGLQYMMIEQRYRKKLFEEAGYVIENSNANPLADMAGSLVNIAVGLYSKE